MAVTNGLLTYRALWPNNTTGILILTGARQVKGWSLHNANAAIRYVKLYDKATAPTVGTDTPSHTIMLPPTSTVTGAWDPGIGFALGLGIGATNVQADADTTAPTAGDIVINLYYF